MILKTYARLFVRSLDDALPVLEALVGRPADLRFWSDDPKLLCPLVGNNNDLPAEVLVVEQAAIGDFLVIAGSDSALDIARKAAGPVIVDDLQRTTELVVSAGADVVIPATTVSTGVFNYIRHSDGSLVEYVQWKPELVSKIIGDQVI